MAATQTSIRAIVTGAAGRMGQEVLAAIADTPGIEAVGAIERAGHSAVGSGNSPTMSDDIAAVLGNADVVIDFSTPENTVKAVKQAVPAGVACVIGTTGLSTEHKEDLAARAQSIPIVLAPNMSVGVNLALDLIADAAARLPEEYDIEIVEIHHSQKADAPSGTALRMAEVAAKARGTTVEESGEFERYGHTGARKRGTIGIQTLRGGDVVGDHTVIFAGPGERIEITHRAQSRQTFARGAVRAALWVVGKKPGLYAMRDVLAA